MEADSTAEAVSTAAVVSMVVVGTPVAADITMVAITEAAATLAGMVVTTVGMVVTTVGVAAIGDTPATVTVMVGESA